MQTYAGNIVKTTISSTAEYALDGAVAGIALGIIGIVGLIIKNSRNKDPSFGAALPFAVPAILYYSVFIGISVGACVGAINGIQKSIL